MWRPLSGFVPLRVIPHDHPLRLGQGRVAEKALNIEGLLHPGPGVSAGKRVPPSVVTPSSQRAFEHAIVRVISLLFMGYSLF